MATAQDSGGTDLLGTVSNAREYVEERLRETDSAMTPSELAGEYGCSNGHIRNCLADMLREDEVERVGHGRYIRQSSGSDTSGDGDAEADETGVSDVADAGDSSDSDTESDADADAEVGAQDDPSVDGDRQSEDTDTEDREVPVEAVEDVEAADGEQGDGPDVGATEAAAAGAGVLASFSDEFDVSGKVIIAVVAMVVLVALLWSSDSSGEESVEQSQETEQVERSGSGLR